MALVTLLVLAICLASSVPYALAAPFDINYGPCLQDGDCISAQQCYWDPGKKAPTGHCRFGSKEFPENVLVRNHRDKRQLPNDDGPSAFSLNQEAGRSPYTVQNPGGWPAYQNEGYDSPELNRPHQRTYSSNALDVGQIGGLYDSETRLNSSMTRSLIKRLLNISHPTQLPVAPPVGNNVPGSAPFVINEDNTRDRFQLNNANDINFIHVATTRGYRREFDSPETWMPGGTRKLGGLSGFNSHVGNGIEDDVDYVDEVIHDPQELKAAAEEAAIRAGEDIPRPELKQMPLPPLWQGPPAAVVEDNIEPYDPVAGDYAEAYGRSGVENHSF